MSTPEEKLKLKRELNNESRRKSYEKKLMKVEMDKIRRETYLLFFIYFFIFVIFLILFSNGVFDNVFSSFSHPFRSNIYKK